jgi:hypothetical protein
MFFHVAQHAPHAIPHAAPYVAPTVNSGSVIAGLIMGGVSSLICLAIVVVCLVSLWKIMVKAGKPGWAAIIPIYNIIVLLEVVGRPIWWLILLFVPIVNIVVAVILALRLAKVFGQSVGFAIGMILLPFIFYPMLGFGDAKYLGPDVA